MVARRRAGTPAARGLYPAIRPYRTGRLRVSPLHELYFEESGNPRGKPVVFLCGTGGRAGEAYDTTKLLRPEVTAYFLDADVTFNADGTYKITKAR